MEALTGFDSLPGLVEAVGQTRLTIAAFLSIAIAGLCYYFFNSAPVWAKLTAFFAVLIFAFALSIRLIAPTGDESANADPGPSDINIMMTLRAVQPPEQRAAACQSLTTELRCQPILAAIADLAPVSVPQVVQAQLQSGNVSAQTEQVVAQAVARQPDQVVAIGGRDEWRVDIFWCAGGANAEGNRSSAETASRRLAETSGQFGGVTIGTVRVRELAAGRAGFPRPGDGLRASIDDMPGKRQAVDAITAFLGAGGDTYAPRPVGSRLARYISLFHCA